MSALGSWMEERKTASRLQVRRIPFRECDEWVLDGELRHESGRYFQVVGVEVRSGPYKGWTQPLLRQTEVGVLGFLTRPAAGGHEWLLQAKTEPGNVNGTQIGPTVQATRSNYERVHGGAPTRYLEWFLGSPDATIAADVTASEQGTRFLSKRNRNLVVTTEAGVPEGPSWRWLASSELRRALVQDFVVNTDARSVLVSSPWELLSDGARPFSSLHDSGFRSRLARSYDVAEQAEVALKQLDHRRSQPLDMAEVALDELPGWTVDEEGVRSTAGEDTSLLYVDVSVADREVTHWSQPLLASNAEATCELWCTEHDGVLRFLFRYSPEPGLTDAVELAPSVQSGLRQSCMPRTAKARVRLSAAQSDEGGRFYRTVCRYCVVEVETSDDITPEDGVWLTLGDIARLARQGGTFTNESRSVISLLLSLA